MGRALVGAVWGVARMFATTDHKRFACRYRWDMLRLDYRKIAWQGLEIFESMI
jgi:hypothetical protein